jgi:hypothetical protein
VPDAPAPSGGLLDTSALGALRERFEVDAGDQRAFARLRAAVAVLSFFSAAALLFSRVPVAIFGVALVGLLVPLAWLRQARSARRRAARPSQHSLALYEKGLLVEDGALRSVLRWSEVTDIAIDEERLDIVLKRKDGEALRIEPRYAGVAIDELMRRLCDARSRGLPD